MKRKSSTRARRAARRAQARRDTARATLILNTLYTDAGRLESVNLSSFDILEMYRIGGLAQDSILSTVPLYTLYVSLKHQPPEVPWNRR